MTQLCVRFHVLAFMHVWYSLFSLASLHRFLIIKPFSQGDFPNKNHPKPSSEHRRRPANPNQASDHASSPQALWLMPGCITWKSFQHHFLHIPLRHSILGIIIRQTLAEHLCLTLKNKTHSLKWSLTDDEFETDLADAKSSTEDNHDQGKYWRKVLYTMKPCEAYS